MNDIKSMLRYSFLIDSKQQQKISSSYSVNNLNPDRYPYLWEVFEASISQRENITLTDFYLSKDFLFHF